MSVEPEHMPSGSAVEITFTVHGPDLDTMRRSAMEDLARLLGGRTLLRADFRISEHDTAMRLDGPSRIVTWSMDVTAWAVFTDDERREHRPGPPVVVTWPEPGRAADGPSRRDA